MNGLPGVWQPLPLARAHRDATCEEDVEPWAVCAPEKKEVHQSTPGSLDNSSSTLNILSLCQEELKTALSDAVAQSPVRGAIAALQVEDDTKTRKQRDHHTCLIHSQPLQLARVRRNSWGLEIFLRKLMSG